MYQVWCLDDSVESGGTGLYTLATDRLFFFYKDAEMYAQTISPSRYPEVRDEKPAKTETTWVYYYYNPFTNELVVVDRQLGFDLDVIKQQIGNDCIAGFAESYHELERCNRDVIVSVLKDGAKLSCLNKYWKERIMRWLS